jgi:hypothetical protein
LENKRNKPKEKPKKPNEEMQIIKKGSPQKWIGNVYSIGTDAA